MIIKKACTVNLDCIEVKARGYFNHDGRSPRGANVAIDPVAKALAAEIIATYNPKTMEEFKQRAIEHLRLRETKDNLIIGGIKNG